MTYFEDFSDYAYFSRLCRPRTKNIGWLERGRVFEVSPPEEMVLELLWEHCKISVAQSRGIHECEFCEPPKIVFARRNGQRVRLGTSEIRVFSRTGEIYAAPNLVYHYIRTHHYKPPDEFLRALEEGVRPPSQEYFEFLKNAGLEWNETHSPPVDQPRYGFKKINGEVQRIEVPNPVYLDES